jgi:serine/threonine protein kinase
MSAATFALKEFMTVQNLSHINLVEYKDFFLHEEFSGLQSSVKTVSVCILMPLYIQGDLEKYLDNVFKSGKFLDEKLILDFSIQLTTGIKYLHEKSIIHRDLKPGNVFLESDKDGRLILKIGDFGLSTRQNPDEVKHSIVGSHGFCAPDIFTGSHGKEVDLFSLGALFYKFLTGRERYMHQEITLNYEKTISEVTQEILKNYNHTWTRVVCALLAGKPEQRPSIDTVLKYLKDYSDKLKPVDVKQELKPVTISPVLVPVKKESIFQYEEELKLMIEMGLTDVDLNKLLLKKHNGDLVKTVADFFQK